LFLTPGIFTTRGKIIIIVFLKRHEVVTIETIELMGKGQKSVEPKFETVKEEVFEN